VQCFALAGTNKKKKSGFGFWPGANRSDTEVVSRGFATPRGPKKRFFMRQIA
jgi:hypothetical protein